MSNDPTHAERQARYRAKQNARFASLEAEVKRLRAALGHLTGKRGRQSFPALPPSGMR
jgi:hypothetical protein